MKQVSPDLWQTTLEWPALEWPAPSEMEVAAQICLHVWERGNVLFYNTGRVAAGLPTEPRVRVACQQRAHPARAGGAPWL